MTNLPRLRPEPIPAISPLPEYLAEGRWKMWYEEVKHVLQVPWMGVITMAYAHYPTFFETWWQGMRDLCASQPFVKACLGNRAFVEQEVLVLNPPPIGGQLTRIGYAPREIDGIRQMIEVFSHGNQPYVVLATLTRYLLEAGDVAGAGEAAPPFAGRHAPDFSVPLVLMEAHHADQATRDVYEDVKRILNLPFVNTDYRALARWPSYWATAWSDLRETAGAPAHETLCQAIHNRCVDQAIANLAQSRRLDGGHAPHRRRAGRSVGGDPRHGPAVPMAAAGPDRKHRLLPRPTAPRPHAMMMLGRSGSAGRADVQVDARRVGMALGALGGLGSPAGSCVWHVVGHEGLVREWGIADACLTEI